MKLTPWEEKGRRELEARIYCPKCGVSNIVRGVDTPYFFEKEANIAAITVFCDKCGTPMRIKKTKAGVESL